MSNIRTNIKPILNELAGQTLKQMAENNVIRAYMVPLPDVALNKKLGDSIKNDHGVSYGGGSYNEVIPKVNVAPLNDSEGTSPRKPKGP